MSNAEVILIDGRRVRVPADQPLLASLSGAGANGGAGAVAASCDGQVLDFMTPVSADVVLGKANFTDTAGGTSASLTRACNGVAFSPDGQKLLVSDTSNHRVLIWNTVPTTRGVPADVVIGQTGSAR